MNVSFHLTVFNTVMHLILNREIVPYDMVVILRIEGKDLDEISYQLLWIIFGSYFFSILYL